MSLTQQIENTVQNTFDPEVLTLENESDQHAGPAPESHFKLTLVSAEFNGQSRVKRHQAVYKALASLMPQFHALALHTYTPEEWTQRGQAPDSPPCQGGH
ncbi:BolA family transcriptional regulator [Thiomicrospira sp. WB1]|uniref:BolA family protein n=1 Tax=Thiomicrospira sp. WB1 TaxID=1685380 RepID=UPI0007471962|nr:BolA family protein [Thiomicrospira sp. WB1]KUJ71705.1 transcriptional regulator [Thiomicrospira sp. WB1]